MSWINHLPPACWSTFWKFNFKKQLGCRFDIMDNESYFFVFWHMQLYMSWYITSFYGFTFLNFFFFSSTLVLTSSCRRSLYTSYLEMVQSEPLCVTWVFCHFTNHTIWIENRCHLTRVWQSTSNLCTRSWCVHVHGVSCTWGYGINVGMDDRRNIVDGLSTSVQNASHTSNDTVNSLI